MDWKNVTRRRAIATLGAAGTVALAGCGGDDDGTGDDGTGDGTGDDGTGDDGTGDGTGDDGTGDDGTGDDGTGDDGTSTGDELDGTLRIGLIQDFSNVLTLYGQMTTSGFLSGLAYKGDTDPLETRDEVNHSTSVGDLDIEIFQADSELNPDTASTVATDLVQQDDVDILFGTVLSDSANRVINTVIDRTDVPFIAGPAAADSITADAGTCGVQVYRANENTGMDATSGGVYIAEETDIEQIALYGNPGAFGQAVRRGYRKVLEARGVEVVENRSTPEGFAEWGQLLQEAEDRGAEAIVGGYTAATLGNLTTEIITGDWDLSFFGGFATALTLGIVGDTLQAELDPYTEEAILDSGFGPFTTRYHWNQYDNEINQDFVDMHLDTWGSVPDLFTSGAFTAASSVVQAVQQEGEVSREAFIEQLPGMEVTDTPKGENGYLYQEYDGQARSAMTIANAVPADTEGWGPAVQPSEPIATVSRDETTTPNDDPDHSCDLTDQR